MSPAIRHAAAALFLILVPGACLAQTPGVSGADLISDCKNYPDSPRPRSCALFASSFAEIATLQDRTANPRGKLCIGKDVPVDELVAGINDWLAKHPGSDKKSGYDIAYNALESRYRCR